MTNRRGESNDSNENPALIKWFSELNKDSENIVGTKGKSIAEMHNLKIPIPPGFIITTEAYNYFIENSPGLKEKIKGMLNKIDYENIPLLNDITEVIINSIIETNFPKNLEEEILDSYYALDASNLSEVYGSALDILQNAQEPIFVAVRSSPIFKNNIKNSLLVQQNSFLNIKGKSELLLCIKRCFATLFTPNEIYSRYKEGKKELPEGIAVIIQKMVDSNKSGTIFTTNPNKKDGNIIINSIWGLGEEATSKTIPPDEYTLNKNLEIINIDVANKEIAITRDSSGSKIIVPLREEKSNQQVLTKKEISRLAKLALQIEEHYKKPQCIDFSIENEEIYIIHTKDLEKEVEKKEEGPQEIINEKIETKQDNKIEKIIETKEKESLKEISPIQENTKTKIKLIVDSPLIAEKASQTNIKSAGLVKIENIILNSGKHPIYYLNHSIKDYEEIIFNGLSEISKHFDEMWIRTLNIKTNELLELEGAPKYNESNPRLGLHGIRFSLKNPRIFEAELNAIKKVSESNKKIGILLPKIISVEEIKKVREILNKINFNDAYLGVIIETPAAIQIITELCNEGINIASIDVKNLTQNILSLDKSNKDVSELYDELHPAVLYQIAYLTRVCKKRGVKCNLILEADRKYELAKFFVENAGYSISTDINDISQLANHVKEIEKEMVKGTDQEPRKYIPGGNKKEIPEINGIENINNEKKP